MYVVYMHVLTFVLAEQPVSSSIRQLIYHLAEYLARSES